MTIDIHTIIHQELDLLRASSLKRSFDLRFASNETILNEGLTSYRINYNPTP